MRLLMTDTTSKGLENPKRKIKFLKVRDEGYQVGKIWRPRFKKYRNLDLNHVSHKPAKLKCRDNIYH